MPPSSPSPSSHPSYILPSYFTKYQDSPHKWDEFAYLEYLFPEGAQLTRLKHQTALNRWIGAIKWLQENSEHGGQATKLLEHYSDENSQRSRKNWYNRKTRNGKINKTTKNGQSVKVNRTTVIEKSAVNVEIQGATFHDVGHVNYGQNYIDHDGGGQQKTNSVHSGSSSSLGQEVGSQPASCRIEGATFNDVDHVNYGQNYINQGASSQQETSNQQESASSQQETISVRSEAASSPDQEVSPPSPYYKTNDAFSSESGSTSVVFSTTKRVLADVIRDSNLPQTHLARAGIIVLYDQKVKGLFKDSEWLELVKREPPLPQLDEVFLNALNGYASDETPNQFRHTARTHPYREADEPHVDSKHAKAEWVDMVILWMLKLYSGYGDLRAHKLLEGWFDACIWSVIFDLSTFSYKWMMPRRKEVQSWSLKSMAAHTDDTKDKFHQRSLYDGIIYDDTHFDRLEFGIFEVAKDFNSLIETKIVHDRQKLYRGMHGMGRLISKTVDHDPEAMKSIQVIGVQNMEFSFRIQVGTPISPDEIIISQGEVQTIPATFDKLQTILLVLKSVGFVMEIMDRSEKAVEERLHRTTIHKPELLKEKLLKGGL